MIRKALIIEDEIIIARYIQQFVQRHFNWEVYIAIDYHEAELEMKNHRPQLLLCDINLQARADGIDIITLFQEEYRFETIFITSYQSEKAIERAAVLRPANYIIKPIVEAQLLAALKVTDVRLSAHHFFPGKNDVLKELLTRSEYEVMQHIACGRSTKEIAAAMDISPLTVKNHRHNICRKLNLPAGNNAILKWAMENKFEH